MDPERCVERIAKMKKKRGRRGKPAEMVELNVDVTRRDIDEARRLGLTGAQMIERSVERALKKKELASALSLRNRRESGRPQFWWQRRRQPGGL
jgi:hypothetical protein